LTPPAGSKAVPSPPFPTTRRSVAAGANDTKRLGDRAVAADLVKLSEPCGPAIGSSAATLRAW
jgi:hypothetical protein